MITKKAVGTNKSACNNKRTGGGWCTRQEEMAFGGQINVGNRSTCTFCEYVGAHRTSRDLKVTSCNLLKYFSFIWGRDKNHITFHVPFMLLKRWCV